MRRGGFDVLRGIAAFGIVGCHLGLGPRTTGGEWLTALCDFNVGLFAAISGFFMNVGENRYIVKRARRLLPLYVAWSVVYIVATAAFDLMADGGCLNECYFSLSYWVRIGFCGDAAAHLWFLICLFYGQAIFCWICCAFEKVRLPQVWQDVVLALASVGLLCCSVMGNNWYCLYPIRLSAFLVLGYLVKKSVKGDWFYLALFGSVIMLGVHLGMKNVLPGFLLDYILVLPVVVLFASNRFESWRLSAILASTSMGVYLVHPLFARGMSFVASCLMPPPYGALAIGLDWIVVWGLSLCSVLVMVKLPVVKQLVR